METKQPPTPEQEFNMAFFKAQHSCEPLKKNAHNPFHKSDYANLEAVISVLAEPLKKNNLFVTQSVDDSLLETTVVHVLGFSKTFYYPLTAKDISNPQAVGAAVSYARRYSLQSIFFLAAEDDDGHQASAPPKTTLPQRAAPVPPPKATGPAPTPNASADHYRFTFGKHSGKTLKEIPEGELRAWMNWVSTNAEKPIKGPMKDAAAAVSVFLRG